jgi:hypothetical protein
MRRSGVVSFVRLMHQLSIYMGVTERCFFSFEMGSDHQFNIKEITEYGYNDKNKINAVGM